jgi:ABC-type transport system involved in cytochrome c biogenesis ATPase subunit
MINLGLVCCFDALQAEMKPGDILLVERPNGAGMTVRYLLPRAVNSPLG